MKKLLTLCCLSFFILHSSFFTLCKAQNVAINATGNQADPSAMLDVSSTSAGVLIPRMNTTQRNLITNPAIGLQIFNTDCNELNFWNGTCWISMGAILAPHSITSNSATTLCASVTATYSITAITGATGYDWAVPAGATINSGQGTTSISVTWGNYSGQVCVRAYDACESSDLTCLDINVNPIPPTPGNITGLASVSPGTTNVSYFIASVSGASSYTWTVPSGATIVTGTGTPVITVNFACNAVSGNVTVTAGSNCGTSTASGQAITVTSYLAANAGSAVFGGAAIGGSPTASGGYAPYTYSWSPNSNLSNATVANPTALCSGSTTTYTVTVTDAGGCTATSSVIVTRNLIASAGSAIFGGAGIGGAPTATGGVSPYTYSWSPNSNLSSYTTANTTALCSGSTTTYTVTVSDANGCQSTSNVTVTRSLAASAGSNPTICLNNSSAIGGTPTATGGNNSSYSYSWNPSTGLSSATTANPTANPTSTTTYTVTATDANGCTATSSMTLIVNALPVSTFTNSSPAETNTSITFSPTTTSGVTSSWSFPSGSPANSTAQNPSVTWSSAGTNTISLTVTSSSTGCSSTTANAITIGNPTVVSFTSSTTWTVPSGVTSVSYLVVAGGGGGGEGGGGGGGLLTGSLSVTPNNSISVTIGAGGSGGSGGGNGSNSVFGSITATGGGGAGSQNNNGNVGGSGGGGGAEGGGSSGGAGTSGQGNSGGAGLPSPNPSYAAGGGGGAGGAGGAATGSPYTNGAGGAGLSSNISGSTVYYAGGGGGGSCCGSCCNTGGPGGNGGGGTGSGSSSGSSGTANTGGGGGGGYNGNGAAGGSGIVIIRY